VSRIWDELKRAEAQRSGDPQEDVVERRKTKRTQPQVSLFVYGSDANNNPFHEETDTINADEGGCLMLLEASVVKGQRLFVVNTANQDERECRVLRVGKLLRGKRRVAVEFLRSAPEFWFDS
jgi:hypothetical protein